ncbi:Na/Pi symporter [Labrys monachus]|uniref:Phosphate:Na+ symporter n=1 Tax=Labrys monachus TaxID=217067 RepID=A0ABU0FAT9_9HYPH|nr:Na/Pi symporter [Labrys monachus]MDQ0391155.1 phosphate:Na+ symporter [Labrys monachus]
MSIIATIAALLSGLGLFFIGVRSLSANLVPLAGRRTRAVFAQAMRGPVSTAVSGTIAGLATQSSSAVSWIIIGFVRAGVVPAGPALLAPSWSNVGTAMLPLLLAVDTTTAASLVIGIVGFITYFRLARGDRMRNVLDAALGAALLLFGMHIVSSTIEPVREAMLQSPTLTAALQSPWLLALIGAVFSFIAQSSSVATAIAVAAVGAKLLTVPAALPVIAGANAGAIFNNLVNMSGENLAGRLVFACQVVQKATGSLLLAAFAAVSGLWPAEGASLTAMAGHNASAQIAVVFTIAQVIGSTISSLTAGPVRTLVQRWTPVNPAEALAQPTFLLREALSDPPAALDLVIRELARLSARLPLMLDHVRAESDPATPQASMLRTAGSALAGTIKSYLATLLDNQPRRSEVATALLLEDAVGNIASLHEALAELATAVPRAAALPTTGSLVEGLHALLIVVADYVQDLGTDDPEFVLGLLGDRDQLMEDLRGRLSSSSGAPADMQDALFRMTILFERVVWLARRVVIDMNQAQKALAAD